MDEDEDRGGWCGQVLIPVMLTWLLTLMIVGAGMGGPLLVAAGIFVPLLLGLAYYTWRWIRASKRG